MTTPTATDPGTYAGTHHVAAIVTDGAYTQVPGGNPAPAPLPAPQGVAPHAGATPWKVLPPPGAAAAPAPAPAAPSVDDVGRRGAVMTACGAAVVLGTALPWVSTSALGASASASALDAGGPGAFIAALGVGLAAYGFAANRTLRVRASGLACTAIVLLLLLSLVNFAVVGSMSGASGGAVQPGIGLVLTVLAGVAAIWPLTGLWRAQKHTAPPAPQVRSY